MDVNTILTSREGEAIYSRSYQMPVTFEFINGDENRFVHLIHVSQDTMGENHQMHHVSAYRIEVVSSAPSTFHRKVDVVYRSNLFRRPVLVVKSRKVSSAKVPH